MGGLKQQHSSRSLRSDRSHSDLSLVSSTSHLSLSLLQEHECRTNELEVECSQHERGTLSDREDCMWCTPSIERRTRSLDRSFSELSNASSNPPLVSDLLSSVRHSLGEYASPTIALYHEQLERDEDPTFHSEANFMTGFQAGQLETRLCSEMEPTGDWRDDVLANNCVVNNLRPVGAGALGVIMQSVHERDRLARHPSQYDLTDHPNDTLF